MKVCYTDGGCSPNPGKGGWAFIVEGEIEKSGYAQHSTNNAMELTALLNLLKHLDGSPAIIYSDSTYVVMGITTWINGWVKNGWVTSSGEDVANYELWQELLDYYNPKIHDIRHVKGHSGNAGNERCDFLVGLARSKGESIENNLKSSHQKEDKLLDEELSELRDFVLSFSAPCAKVLAELDERLDAIKKLMK